MSDWPSFGGAWIAAAHLDTLSGFGELLGYLGALVTIGTYSMRTMIPLRITAICANGLFVAYGFLAPSYPQLFLHSILLPLNCVRLRQMIKLVTMVQIASNGTLSMDWIKSFTSSRNYRAGTTLFSKSDIADSLYYPVSGQYRLVESGIDILPGTIVGEFGMVMPDNKRTQTLTCTHDGTMLVINYSQIKQIYFQNPQFGFFFLKLIATRLAENHRKLEKHLEQIMAEHAKPQLGYAAGENS
ncbi:MAG: Crp/Fnr family transcriptional regulator, partial [Rhizobiales bacterium]|nr:Crp/Fnr family transcriptional regulator [Hyphomicrobiales bacterium]